MFILGNLFMTLAKVVDVVLTISYWLILARALISWVNPDPFNPIVQFLERSTEPVLERIRRLLPPMGIDFSPIIAFILIIFLQGFLVASLRDLSYSMRQSQENKTYMFEPHESTDQKADPMGFKSIK